MIFRLHYNVSSCSFEILLSLPDLEETLPETFNVRDQSLNQIEDDAMLLRDQFDLPVETIDILVSNLFLSYFNFEAKHQNV